MRNRSIRFRRSTGANIALELDITPILDLFIVVLIFLVYSSQNSGILTSTTSSIELPISSSQTLSKHAVNVQVSKSQMWVDEKEILNSQTLEEDELFDKDGKKIIPLYNQLIKLKSRVEKSYELSSSALPFSGDINLVIDKTLKYNYLKRIMFTCASAGFKKIRFISVSDSK